MRLSQIDETNRHDHSRLGPDDICYHLYEYTSHRDYSFSRTNNLISNLKKKPSWAGRPGYDYKVRAIGDCAAALRGALNPAWLAEASLVPVPCSKAPGHADHDDRMERVCRAIGPDVDVRSLVVQTDSTVASHEAMEGERVTVEALLDLYRIDETQADPAPRRLAVVDDVLTSGTHFRAMHALLGGRFPDVPIIGLFIARRVFPA